MCRTGGRRCPAYSDPQAIADRNARRRKAYAAKKSVVQPPLEMAFPSLSEVRKVVGSEDRELRGKKLEEELTSSEVEAVGYYTESGYITVRNELVDWELIQDLQDNEDVEEPDEDINVIIDHLDNVIAKAIPPQNPVPLYRGINVPISVHLDEVDNWVDAKFPIGGIIQQDNFMSTSSAPQTAVGFSQPIDSMFGNYEDENEMRDIMSQERSIVMEILSKKGAVILPSLAGGSYDEQETLLPRNARLKIVGVHKKQSYSYMTRFRPIDPEIAMVVNRTVIQVVDAD